LLNKKTYKTLKQYPMKTTGIILIVIGLLLTIFTAVKVFTKEKVVDLGQVEVTHDKPHKVSWSPVVGVVVMGIGGIMLWQGSRKGGS
jgi:hypothetical protein